MVKNDFLEIAGVHSGPRLQIKADRATLERIVNRLNAIPTLGHMRGTIVLGDGHDVVDDCLELRDGPDPTHIWQVLGRATRLGMIQGRGVPAAYITR